MGQASCNSLGLLLRGAGTHELLGQRPLSQCDKQGSIGHWVTETVGGTVRKALAKPSRKPFVVGGRSPTARRAFDELAKCDFKSHLDVDGPLALQRLWKR